MGNAAGSCCSVKTDNDKKEVISKGGVDPASAPTVATTTSTGDSPMGARGPSAPASVALGAVALKAFQSRLEESIDMIVVIAVSFDYIIGPLSGKAGGVLDIERPSFSGR